MNEKVHFDFVRLSALDQSFDLGLDKPAQADNLIDSKQVYDFQESLTAFVDELLPHRDLKVVQRNVLPTLGHKVERAEVVHQTLGREHSWVRKKSLNEIPKPIAADFSPLAVQA